MSCPPGTHSRRPKFLKNVDSPGGDVFYTPGTWLDVVSLSNSLEAP